jgi:predicted chitinase
MDNFFVEAFPVSFGDPTNKIIKSINLSTDEDKVSAESIVSLQKIVDNDNSNKTVSKDCSTLSILEGRSYTAKLDTLGNAQISPMQFFYLQNNRIFSGLYQIKKVEHNITPNDMTTSFEGIKISYGNNTYGGIHPITLQDYKDAVKIYKEAPLEKIISSVGHGTYETTVINNSSTNPIQNALIANGILYNPVNTNDTGGNKEVQGYLKNPILKKRILAIVSESKRQGITQNIAIAALLAIASKETGFNLRNETNYSKTDASRIKELFIEMRKYTNSEVDIIKKDEKKFFDIIYGGENGNGLNEGYKFRGRGYNQITFKGNYEEAKKGSGVDFISNPDLLNVEGHAEKAFIGYMVARSKNMSSSKKSQYNTTNGNDFKGRFPNFEWISLTNIVSIPGKPPHSSGSRQHSVEKLPPVSTYFILFFLANLYKPEKKA